MDFVFDLEENKDKITDLRVFMKENRSKKGVLMSALHMAQESFGYLPLEIQETISQDLNVPLSEIYGVATFYSQFSLIPKGKYKIGVCMGTACYVKDAQKILNEVEKELDIEVGQTTQDRLFSIQDTRCLGACGLAPVMVINDDVYGKVKPEDIKEILDSYK